MLGFWIGFLFLGALSLLFAVLLIALIGVPALILSFLISEKENRLSNGLSVFLGVSLFSFLFSLFSFLNYYSFTVSDRGWGDCRYVKISENYLYESIDGGLFFIEREGSDVYDIDSIADCGDLIYGKTRNGYFSLSMADGALKEDSSFANLELPDACAPSDFMDGEAFYEKMCGILDPSLYDLTAMPFFFALLISVVSSYFVKKVVKRIEKWIRDRRARKKAIEE
ncbi:MAG: hypothetical protein J6Y37_00885 [Paludibacteraceae bacterium]|nr:hypothetical protein [Paludibacteraceae bacterium]